MSEINPEKIIQKVGESLDLHFSLEYPWRQIVDGANLTEEEKKWAKENLQYCVMDKPKKLEGGK